MADSKSWEGGEGWDYGEFSGSSGSSSSSPVNFSFGGLGGLFGGGRRGARFAQADYERQKALLDEAYERSLPWDIQGIGGGVTYDKDNKMITSTLSDKNQAIYDEMMRRQGIFGQQATDLASGGWQDAQQQIFDQQRGLYSEGDARSLAEQREREVATGRGPESTAGYWERRARQDAINQRDAGLQADALAMSQGLIDSGLQRQQGDISSAMSLAAIPTGLMSEARLAGQGSKVDANMAGVSNASTRWADALAMGQAKRRKAQTGLWDSLFSSSKLGSLFS